MEGQRNKMTMLVTQINLMKEENQNLRSMLKRMISSYDDLQKQISFQEKQPPLTSIDRSQIFSPEHQIEDNFNFRILSPRSVTVDSGDTVSQQSNDSHERVGEMDGKNTRFMDDQQLPSSKRKISHLQSDQFQNGMMNSSMDESPTKKHQVLTNGSAEQTAAVPRRIVTLRTKSEASMISDGCRWRKYGQKSTRNNPCPRSYYKCVTAPGCTVKKQVQRCAEDSTIVITTYEGEHTHPLSPLATAAMQAGSSNQLVGEGINAGNFLADCNQSIPFLTGCNARISTSSPFPTIILDLTDNQPNPAGLQLQPAHLAAGTFQHFTPLSNDMCQVLNQNQLGNYSSNDMGQVLNQNQLGNYSSTVQDSVASLKADPNFTAALAVAIADSMLKMGAPVQGMPKSPPARHSTSKA